MIPKFRAWGTYKNEWCENFYITESGLIYDMERPHRDLIGAVPIEQSSLVVMQSTGVFDENGVEIFEGDVVSNGHKNQVVKFGQIEHEENYGDIAIYQGFNVMLGCGYSEVIMEQFEVIGNIYENPDLLEVE